MDIDESAPIRALASIEIDATPSEVWAAITDVDRWTSWNPQVREAGLEGPLAPGATLRWKAGPGTIRSVVRAADQPRELGWTGRTMGIDAVHVWRLEPAGSGTRLTTEESWRGWPTRLMRRRLTRTLEEAIAAGLASLKTEVERRARAARDDADRVETAA